VVVVVVVVLVVRAGPTRAVAGQHEMRGGKGAATRGRGRERRLRLRLRLLFLLPRRAVGAVGLAVAALRLLRAAAATGGACGGGGGAINHFQQNVRRGGERVAHRRRGRAALRTQRPVSKLLQHARAGKGAL
jgi:hypothetical protein